MKKYLIVIVMSVWGMQVYPSKTVVNGQSLETAIVKTVRAFQEGDFNAFHELVFGGLGVAYVDMPGMYWRMGIYSWIPYNEEEAIFKPTPLRYEMVSDYRVRFEPFPVFDCPTEKWNKEIGTIYCDTTKFNGGRFAVAKMENKYTDGHWETKRLKEFKKTDRTTYKVMVIGKEGGYSVFTFYLTFWENKWYLTMIQTFEECGA